MSVTALSLINCEVKQIVCKRKKKKGKERIKKETIIKKGRIKKKNNERGKLKVLQVLNLDCVY